MTSQAPRHRIEAARTFVSAMFHSLRRADLAALVLAGEGDDFPEVALALALLEEQADQLERQAQALRQYSEPGFWDEDLPGGSLAAHDRGEMARNVLAGRPPFYHRD